MALTVSPIFIFSITQLSMVWSNQSMVWKMLWLPHSDKQPHSAQQGKMPIPSFLCRASFTSLFRRL